MTPEQQSPIVLTAMTLRGIGSYVHGARLQIGPLTILCGKNGSGKSTWLKVLNVLKRSLAANCLPFAFAEKDWDVKNIRFTNAFHHVADTSEFATVDSSAISKEFGSSGTVGLELMVVRDCNLDEFISGSVSPNSFPVPLFWGGQCKAGTRLRVRIAHPTYWSDATDTPHLKHLVELQIDGGPIVRMTGDRDPMQTVDQSSGRVRRSRPYELTCSPSFLDVQSNEHLKMVPVAKVLDLVNMRCGPLTDQATVDFVTKFGDFATQFGEIFDKRIRQILQIALDGFFYVGAIRRVHNYLSLDELKDIDPEAACDARHVGEEGEYSWLLERRFDGSDMRETGVSSFSNFRLIIDNCLSVLGQYTRDHNSLIAYLWSVAAPSLQDQIRQLETDNVPYGEFAEYDAKAEKALAEFLDSVLNKRDFANAEVWATVDEKGCV